MLLPVKPFHFVQLLRVPFYWLDGMLPNSIHESLNKAH